MLLALLSGCAATRPAPTADPEHLRLYARTHRYGLGAPHAFRIAPGGREVLFLRARAGSRVQDLLALDPATGAERTVLSVERLLQGAAERLSPEERARHERLRTVARGITAYELSKDGRRLLVPLAGRLFRVDGDAVRPLPAEGGYALDARLSPDGRRVACVRGGDVWVIDLAAGTQRRLTHATGTVTFGRAEFVAEEEMGRYRGIWWSPDSRSLVIQRTDTAGMETLALADPAHPEAPVARRPYPRPGHPNADVRLLLFDLAGGEPRELAWDRGALPYLVTVRWPERGLLTLVVQDRLQREARVLTADPATGATRTLLVERDAAWLNIDQSVPAWLPDGSGFLWSTERTGDWSLELRSPQGARVKTLMDGGYRAVLLADDGRVVVAGASSPLASDVRAVDLATGRVRLLAQSIGRSGGTFRRGTPVWVHVQAGADGRSQAVVQDGPGGPKRIGSETPAPPYLPRVELTAVGPLRMHAAIVRPRDFEPGRRYPVLLYVYGGPHHNVVAPRSTWYLLHQWLADHGFIVVMADGRGTPGRGRAWERAIAGEVSAPVVADQMAALEALGARYPELDLGRVGVFGWSFGGYMTAMLVLRRPDRVRCGVAGAPVADWRDYDTHYTERYLGLPEPNRRGYDLGSLLHHARQPGPHRPLLVIHGTVDDNVYAMHAIKLVDALFRAGRPVDFLPLSGSTHMVQGEEPTLRLYQRIVSFFRSCLASPAP